MHPGQSTVRVSLKLTGLIVLESIRKIVLRVFSINQKYETLISFGFIVKNVYLCQCVNMDLSTLYKIFIDHSHERMSFIYHGNFQDDITSMVVDLSASGIGSGEQSWINNKVSFLIAECFQHVMQHNKHEDEPDIVRKSLFSIRDMIDSVYISSLNHIKKEQTGELASFIDHINELDKDELKKLYIQHLTADDAASKQSDLSLIEIARRSGNKLTYYFDVTDEQLAQFYFQVQLTLNKKVSRLHNRINYEISKSTYQLVSRHQIYMIHKGNFSQDMILPMIEMTEKNLDQKLDFHNKKRSFHILVELLQNISKHGYEMDGRREGVFMLSTEKGYFSIMAGNYIANSQIERIKLLLDFINDNQRDDVMEYYKGILRFGKPTEKGGAGVGLIDIMRNSAGKIDYRIYSVNASVSFYCIKVRISLS